MVHAVATALLLGHLQPAVCGVWALLGQKGVVPGTGYVREAGPGRPSLEPPGGGPPPRYGYRYGQGVAELWIYDLLRTSRAAEISSSQPLSATYLPVMRVR